MVAKANKKAIEQAGLNFTLGAKQVLKPSKTEQAQGAYDKVRDAPLFQNQDESGAVTPRQPHSGHRRNTGANARHEETELGGVKLQKPSGRALQSQAESNQRRALK